MNHERMERYRDRREAGQILAAHVMSQIGHLRPAVVLALPRGGVPVGFEVARSLDAPLDLVLARKLGVPGHEEFAMGALTEGGTRVLSAETIADLDISEAEIAQATERERAELRRQQERYHGLRPGECIAGLTAILVDDGLATGWTMRAAIAAVRERGPARLLIAVPVGAPETCRELSREVGTLICPLQPSPFRAVGLWYRDFAPTSDEEVCDCLAAARANLFAQRFP